MINRLGYYTIKGAASLFFFSFCLIAQAQEIFWKGKELQSGQYKTIEGEITIRTPEDTIRSQKAILYNQPKKAILKGNLSLVRKGATVTGDSGIYYPQQKLAYILGNGHIQTEDGSIRSSSFLYSLNSKILSSNQATQGEANGIRFQSNQFLLFPETKNMKLFGNAQWENDTIKGVADTIYLDRANNLLKMSKKAKIIFKKKQDEVAGRYIELDLKANKISKIEGSTVKRDEVVLKANKITQSGENYELREKVEIASKDSGIISKGQVATLFKNGMDMSGKTVTRLLDQEKKEIFIHAPFIVNRRLGTEERTKFFKRTNIRGEFEGYADSIFVLKTDSAREIYLYQDCHLQNDTLYMEGDTLELIKKGNLDIIRAKRNALMLMKTPPDRINIISAAYIQITKKPEGSEMYATGDSESFLWNDEKGSVGLNHTQSPEQKAWIANKKVSKVRTKGKTESKFSPLQKVDMGYLNPIRIRLKETYQKDSLSPELGPVPNFLLNRKKKR